MFESVLRKKSGKGESWFVNRKSGFILPPLFSAACLTAEAVAEWLDLASLALAVPPVWAAGICIMAAVRSGKCFSQGKIREGLLVWGYSFYVACATLIVGFYVLGAITGMH